MIAKLKQSNEISQKHAGVVNLEMFISINFHQDMV